MLGFKAGQLEIFFNHLGEPGSKDETAEGTVPTPAPLSRKWQQNHEESLLTQSPGHHPKRSRLSRSVQGAPENLHFCTNSQVGLLLVHRRHCEKCWSGPTPPFLDWRKLRELKWCPGPLLRTESGQFCRPRSVLSFPHPKTSHLWPDCDIQSLITNLYLENR